MTSQHPTPAIILVGPQMVENIGMTARAMLNFGLRDLRLVRPRDAWPLSDWLRDRLYAAASKADEVLENVKIFDDVKNAIADLNYVGATCPRHHDLMKFTYTPRAATEQCVGRARAGEKIGFLFGPERNGLTNDEIALANDLICIPTNPEFYSLNLAQAVLVMAYEWRQASTQTPDKHFHFGKTSPATKDELHMFLSRLENLLDERGFYTSEEIRPTMRDNLYNAMQRADMTGQELRTWHGVVSALMKPPRKPHE